MGHSRRVVRDLPEQHHGAVHRVPGEPGGSIGDMRGRVGAVQCVAAAAWRARAHTCPRAADPLTPFFLPAQTTHITTIVLRAGCGHGKCARWITGNGSTSRSGTEGRWRGVERRGRPPELFFSCKKKLFSHSLSSHVCVARAAAAVRAVRVTPRRRALRPRDCAIFLRNDVDMRAVPDEKRAGERRVCDSRKSRP